MIKAIIFDFDGVLVESVDIKTKAFTKLFKTEGKDIVEKIVDYHLKNAGVSRFEKIRYIYKNILNRDLSEKTFDYLCQQFSHLVVNEVINAPFIKGAKEFLDNYSKSYQCFVASATPENEIKEIINRRNMDRYLKGVYGAPQKKEDIVREILAVSSVLSPQPSSLNPQSFVYVGDALSDYRAAIANQVNFIAMINSDNKALFKDIDCIKIEDLSTLKYILDKLDATTVREMNYSVTDSRLRKLYDYISSVNMRAYKDIYLLSNPVLNKDFSGRSNFLRRFLTGETVRHYPVWHIVYNLSAYYTKSFIYFMLYLLQFCGHLIAGPRFSYSKNCRDLILIDTFFKIEKIIKEKGFSDPYFPELESLIRKLGKNYAYLPIYYGISKIWKKYGLILKVFNILKKSDMPVLDEFELLKISDLVKILRFIAFYPFHVLRFLRKLNTEVYEALLLRYELIDTLSHITFYGFARYLQGIRIANLSFDSIKVISWYENQTIHKNLYKGLRIGKNMVKIYGAQLFLYSPNLLSIIPDDNEEIFKVVPDKILCNGPFYIPLKSKLNYTVGPSLRYSKIFSFINKGNRKQNILVLLPYFVEEVKNLIDLLAKTDITSESVVVKAHPAFNLEPYRKMLPSYVNVTDDDTFRLLESAKIIVGTASGTLIEVASLGIPVIVIKNSNSYIDYNPLPEYGKGIIWMESETPDELIRQINYLNSSIDKNRVKITEIAQRYRQMFFSPPSEESIIEAFDL